MPVNNPRHSRFFWRSSAMFCILDSDRQFKEVNAAWEKTLGLSTGQLLAKNYLDFIHVEDQPSTKYYFDQLNEGLTSVSFSARFRHYDGQYRNILWEINGAASVEYAYYAVGMDITAREQPMIADEMISVLQEGVVLQYANGTIGACNPSAERILGLSAEQMMGWTLADPDWSLIREDGSPFPTEAHPAICTLRTGQSYSDVVIGIIKTDESLIWLRINSYPLWRDDVTTPYAVVISFSDITLFKESEQALRKNAEQHPSKNNLSENNYDLWDWDLSTNEVNFSPRWKAMLGFEEHELINHVESWHQRIHPADYKRVMADIQNHLEGLTQVCDNIHRLQHKEGSYRWILNRSVMVRDPSGKPHRMVGTHVDVTEPRRIEEELQETEKKYRQLMDTESDAVFIIDAVTTDILDTNKTASQMYGYNRNQLLKTKKIELSAQPDKTIRSIKKGMKYTSQQYHRKQDGTVFPVEVTTSPFVWKGKQVLMVTVRDIGERQKIETALWESESKYRQLFEAASNPIIVFDANSQQIFDVNRAAIDLYGYTKEEWLQMVTEDVSAEPVKKRAAFGSLSKKVQVVPLRWHKKKDGNIFPVEISTGNTYLFQGRSLICATLRDITERKAAEEALRKEKDFINTLVQASPAFFFAINPDGKLRMINKAMLTALGYTFEETIKIDFLNTFVPKNERPLVSTEFENLTQSLQPSLLEYHVLGKSGKPLLVEWHSRAIIKANGALDFFFAVGIDVTERKKAQGHLRLFKSIIESSEEAIAVSNTENQLIYVNPAYEKLLGRTLRETKQLNLLDYYPPEVIKIWEEDIFNALINNKSWEGEIEILYRDNSSIPIWQRVDAVRDAQGTILFTFILMHDISERRRAWETLRKQWEEHQTIFNSIPAMIWYRDKHNRLLRANKLATKVFKLDNEPAKTFTNCQDIIELGRPQYGLLQSYQTPAGDVHWLQVDKIPYRDLQGNIMGAIVFAVDITEYKQTQVHLQVSEERMHLIVENMPVMLMALDNEGQITVWNQVCEAVSGFSSREILSNPQALEMLYPDSSERQKMLEQWKGEGEEVRWESQMACRNSLIKTILWTSVSKRFPIPGWRAWYLGQNVSQSDQALSSEQETLVTALLSSARLGICITDDRGRFLQVNRAYAELYGYRTEELIGQPFTLVLPLAYHNEAVREYYSLLMTHEEPTLLKRRGEQHRNGQSFDVQIMASRVILEDRRRLLLSVVSKWIEPKIVGSRQIE